MSGRTNRSGRNARNVRSNYRERRIVSSSEESSDDEDIPAVAPSTPRRVARPARATGLTPSVRALSVASPATHTLASGRVIRVTPVPPPVLPGLAQPARATSNRRARRSAPNPQGSGTFNETPCLRCTRSALRGRSDGQCEITIGGGRRCLKCSSGHSCTDVPDDVARAARGLRDALVRQARSSTVHRLRTAVRVLLELHGLIERPERPSTPEGEGEEELTSSSEESSEEEEEDEEDDSEDEEEEDGEEEYSDTSEDPIA